MKGGHDVPISKVISRYDKSIVNCGIATAFANRTYIYDNSIDDREALLLFRASEGHLTKQYTEAIPQWALPIYNQLDI